MQRTRTKRLIAATLLGIALALGVVSGGTLVGQPTSVLAGGPGGSNGGSGGGP
jgi:hypothetical protein